MNPSPLLQVAGGTVYDPARGIDGRRADLWIQDGQIVAPSDDPELRPARTIDASGLIVMPGGIDMHCHIAGPKVNAVRKLRPEEKRTAGHVRRTSRTHSGTLGSCPSTMATGYTYAGLGYTTAFDAAVPPLLARHAHQEMADTPCLDNGFYVLAGNNHYAMQALKRNDPVGLRNFLGWLLGATRGYAPKIVNPGGVEIWKHRPAGYETQLDEPVDQFDVTPRQIIAALARAADELDLPHGVHIHANMLGLPGNWKTTLETMRSLEGHRGHMAHIQFHSYGGGEEDENSFNSKVEPLVEYVNANANITLDVGQVMFGPTTSTTGDGPLGYYLHQVYGGRWHSADVEHEAGCGIVPIAYRNKSRVHAIQWAIGLEWFLMADDPWRVALSTDHPNGGTMLEYPKLIHLLMDRSYRDEALKTVHPAVRKRTGLAGLKREYTLSEICIITRAAPARILGLRGKGHLGPGADADVTIYEPGDDPQEMFALPRYVIKSGEVIIDDGELRRPVDGQTHSVAPEYDRDFQADIESWFDDHYSLRLRNFAMLDG
jgi:formylmethanofuran dehydrogenase subunit A